MFSSCRNHGAQYCGVIASRVPALWLAPPRWTTLPRKITAEPAGMITCTGSGAATVNRSSVHRWLPGSTSVAPLVVVKSSNAQIVLTPVKGCGRGPGS